MSHTFSISQPLTHFLIPASMFKVEICDYLLKSGANVEYQSNFMTPILVLTSQKPLPDEFNDSLKCAKLLIEAGANVNCSDKFETTPMLFAAINKHLEMIQLLFENGANVNHVDKRGFNALHHACHHGEYDVCVKLIECGCNYKLLNQAGCSPIDIAYAQGYSDLATFMDSGCKGVFVKTSNNDSQPQNSHADKQLSDLELFLTGLDLLEFLPLLQDENCLSFKQLLTLSDSELQKIGITQLGVRKKILNGIHEVNKKEWSNSSFPHTSEFSRYLSCTETNGMMKNLLNHTQYMTSSIVYLRKQLSTDPSCFLSTNKGENTLNSVLGTVNQNLDQFREIYHQVQLLDSQLKKLRQIPDADVIVDEVPSIDGKSSTWSIYKWGLVVTCLMTTSGAVAFFTHSRKS